VSPELDVMKRRLLSLACATALLVLGAATPARADGPTRRDDAFHFATDRDGQHDATYTEWWYFNLFDPLQGVQAALTYAVLDPANLSGFGLSAVTALVYTPEAQFTETAVFDPSAFFASDQQADVLIASGSSASSVQVLGDDLYRIVGSIDRAHRVSWDLLYLRLAPPWLGSDRRHVGLFPWERMSWLQYMPGASVTGEITVDGRRFSLVNTRGYHDHNWGEWLPFTVKWNWAQYFDARVAFSIGDFRDSATGVVSLATSAGRTVFAKDQYSIVHTDWQFDAAHLLFFPTTTWVIAQNADTTAVVRLRTLATIPLLPPPELPLPLVPVIYEQTAEFLGWVWQKSATGAWTFARAFGGGGFKEYTDVTVSTR
jgi:hypothetical protein